jgi:hypothetical protein
MTEEIEEYLARERVQKRKIMASFRCENEERENGIGRKKRKEGPVVQNVL